MRNHLNLIALSLSLAGIAGVSGTVFAQAPAAAPTGIVAGAAVKDTNGGDVGTILRVEGQYVVLKTDKHEVRLPASAFTPNNGALLFGLTREAVNAKVEEALAASAAKIAPGAAVSDPSGAAVGSVTAVDAESVTVKLTSGTLVRLQRAAVAPGANGVVVGATLAQLEATAKANAPKPSTPK